jgi:hypothetical protein
MESFQILGQDTVGIQLLEKPPVPEQQYATATEHVAQRSSLESHRLSSALPQSHIRRWRDSLPGEKALYVLGVVRCWDLILAAK